MNTLAANGAPGPGFNSLSSFVFASLTIFAGLSSGDGRMSTAAERSSFTPIFATLAPQKTGKISPEITPFLNPFEISSGVNSLPLRYSSKSSSLFSAITSINAFLRPSALVLSSLLNASIAELSIKFTTPLKPVPVPIGMPTSTHPLPSLSFILLNVILKSIFSLFILLIIINRGSFCSLAIFQNFSVPTSTPSKASTSKIALSTAVRQAIASPIKSA